MLNRMLEPDYVAVEVVDAVLRNKVEILLPPTLKFAMALKNP